jgi:hypothetical protein
MGNRVDPAEYLVNDWRDWEGGYSQEGMTSKMLILRSSQRLAGATVFAASSAQTRLRLRPASFQLERRISILLVILSLLRAI